MEEGVVLARKGGSPPCTGRQQGTNLTYRLVVTFPNLCSCLLAVYAEEVMGGILHGSDLPSPEFSVGTEGEGPITGIPALKASGKGHLIHGTVAEYSNTKASDSHLI